MLDTILLQGIQSLSREVELKKLLPKLLSLIHQILVWEKYLVVVSPFANQNSQIDSQSPGLQAIYSATAADSVTLSPQLEVENVLIADYQTQIPQTLLTYLESLGQSIFVKQATEIAAFSSDLYLSKQAPENFLGVPLLDQDRFYGIIYLGNCPTPQSCSLEIQNLIQVLATQTAIALGVMAKIADRQQAIASKVHKEQLLGQITLEIRFRQWTKEEIELLEAVAVQMGIAIAQGDLLAREQQQKLKLNHQNHQLQREIEIRREAETALRLNEELYRSIFEQIDIGIAEVIYENGQLIRVNAKFCDITGYSETELLQKKIADLTYAEDRSTLLTKTQQLQDRKVSNCSWENRYLD